MFLNSPDTQYIYVNVGFGFHAQLTLDEALTFISKKEGQLSKYVGAGSTCPDEGCYADDCLILANAITYFILAWNNRKADVYTQKASQIRAHIKLVSIPLHFHMRTKLREQKNVWTVPLAKQLTILSYVFLSMNAIIGFGGYG